MSLRTKNILYSILLIGAVYIVWLVRNSETHPDPIAFKGQTMGTNYSVIYFDDEERDLQASVDSLLLVFNESLSTYIATSEISRFNTGSSFKFQLPYFFPVLERSKQIVQATDGAFDPTVMPLVNAWGFGPDKFESVDTAKVESALALVGFERIQFNKDSVWKTNDGVQLDFSAIAKGYGVDVVSNFLGSKGIDNVFVEIGGEVITKGRNLKSDRLWEIAILDPNSTYVQPLSFAFAQVNNQAVATSGNYFNYRESNGIKYSHSLNPKTGYPIKHKILSATIFAKDCMTADAWATAAMVMGHEKFIEVLHQHQEIKAFLLYSSNTGAIESYISPGLHANIKINSTAQ